MNLRDKLEVGKYNLLGNFYLKGGDITTAAKYFERSLEINPDDEKAHYNLGCCYLSLKRIKYAEKEFRNVLKLNLGNDLAWMRLGNIYMLDIPERKEEGIWYDEIGKRINELNEVCKNPLKMQIEEIIEKYSNSIGIFYVEFDENKNISFAD
ncbi:MAG: hypothetical protein DRP06_00470 [Candidatus Aenigmatarchaeota archaeon]|nr:MAG: hypothetical protein DRP06_00470 [Candidatus Aenigmarchaeota archaeon]